MSTSNRLSRRTILRGLGASMALPMLEAMTPSWARGAAAAGDAPMRMAFLYVPNGVHMPEWTPKGSGNKFTLPSILQPLSKFKDDILFVSGLALEKARANGDGAGDHARANSTFLTSVQIRKTAGANIRAGISVDQVAAQKIGSQTRFPSLELGCERGALSGNCDSGYSCAYQSNISWRSETTPNAKEIDPQLVFDRLFNNGMAPEVAQQFGRRLEERKSILDFVSDDAHRLMKKLGPTDRRKLDEYFTSVREVEQRIERSQQTHDTKPTMARPNGIPADYQEHIRLMLDLMVLALQTDLTRIATFPFANDGSNRSYRFLEIPEGHHDLSHHGKDAAKQEKIRKINAFHIHQLAYLLGKLKGIREGDGTLLDHCMIVYGSAIGDGDRHNHDDLPILFCGRAKGTVKTGRHVVYPHNTPLASLYVSMLERMGVSVPAFGDSKGPLPQLS